VVTCDPGKGWSGDPYKQLDPSCFAPPQPGSLGMESARYFLHGPPQGQHRIRINDQRRICFRWREDGVHDVEIVDYH